MLNCWGNIFQLERIVFGPGNLCLAYLEIWITLYLYQHHNKTGPPWGLCLKYKKRCYYMMLITAAIAWHSRRITTVASMASAHVLFSHYCSCQHYCCDQDNNCEYCFSVYLSRQFCEISTSSLNLSLSYIWNRNITIMLWTIHKSQNKADISFWNLTRKIGWISVPLYIYPCVVW
jgi:hypothetical protein